MTFALSFSAIIYLMRKWNSIDQIFFILLIVGGLNWGLVGLFDFNLVAALFGIDSALSNIVYIVVGIAALYTGYRLLATKADS